VIIKDFKATIDTWIKAIQEYSFEDLCNNPDNNSWSLGQVCMHPVNDTDWFIEQIKIYMLNDDNTKETMLPFAQTTFTNNSFPDERLTNPANDNMPQPEDKKVLLQFLLI
jgi:hypothetical protein